MTLYNTCEETITDAERREQHKYATMVQRPQDKKFLVKILAVLAGTAALCAIVYFISPGAPAVGIAEQPSDSTLKLTDTILNLTYLCGGVAILSIIVGSVVNAIRNRK